MQRRRCVITLLHLFCTALSTVAAPPFVPVDNYLLACAAADFDGQLSAGDVRRFLPDSSSLALSAPGSTLVSSRRRSARMFPSPATYSIPIAAAGPHLLRLHFHPTDSNRSRAATFNVSASGLTLLSRFSPSATDYTVKEFLLDMDIPVLSVSLAPLPGSFAFLSALELFSVPYAVVPAAATEVVASGGRVVPLASPVLETLHRVNVGGPTVTPSNDTLWRSWSPDDRFLDPQTRQLAEEVVFAGRINYVFGGATREAAPDSVYNTARGMNTMIVHNTSSKGGFKFNLSWHFPVSSSRGGGLGFLVRLHFCDIVSKALNELYFDVYINTILAYKDLDLSSLLLFLASPYYMDFLVPRDKSGTIKISIAPSDHSLPSNINAILNGIEIMKIHGVSPLVPLKKRHHRSRLVIGLAVGGSCLLVFVVLLVVLVKLFKWKMMKQRSLPMRENALASSLVPTNQGSSRSILTELASNSAGSNLNLQLRIPFSEILLATRNFDENCKIGSGGFGNVYKGVLRDGTEVAVKRGVRGSQQGIGEFQTEIVVLSKIRHRHLVSLIGYCEEQSEMILVYEFMENGPLRDHLYGSNRASLPWKQRLEVCIGSARGLHYLHTGSAEGIIHRDVKSSNILLDGDYSAKVADFGLSRLGTQNQTHVTTSVKGSFGYLDPEYFKTQQLTDKSDVYSFGVVLLEILCGRPALDSSLPWDQVNLAEWGMKWQKKGQLQQIMDPFLKGNVDPGSLRKFGETAEKCLAQYGIDRPSMGDVLWNLEYALQLHETSVYRQPRDGSRIEPYEFSLLDAPSFDDTTTSVN